MNRQRIAIVGAGIAGLTCARRLRAAGRLVEVFDKSRGPSGRISTRRGSRVSFDHGAQYFTARDPLFAQTVSQWVRDGLAQRWDGRIVSLDSVDGRIEEDLRSMDRFVGLPGMNAIGKSLASGVPLQLGFRATRIDRQGERLILECDQGPTPAAGGYDAVVLAMPAPQAQTLAAAPAPKLATRIGAATMEPCWTVMLGFAEPLPVDFDGAFVAHSPLSWIARNSSKPGRPEGECWVLHGSPEWSRAHFESDPTTVADNLCAAFEAATGKPLPPASESQVHRWAYSLPSTTLSESYVFDPASGVGACGDWCGGPRVEGAFLSGLAMAARLLEE